MIQKLQCCIFGGREFSVSFMVAEALADPTILIQVLRGCDELLVTQLAIGNENQLTVDAVPAALFEQPTPGVAPFLPSMSLSTVLMLKFRSAEDADFNVYLGSRREIREKYEEL